VNSLPNTVTRQRRGCDLNPGPTASESGSLTTRLPNHPLVFKNFFCSLKTKFIELFIVMSGTVSFRVVLSADGRRGTDRRLAAGVRACV